MKAADRLFGLTGRSAMLVDRTKLEEFFARDFTFEGAIKNVERRAVKILEAAGLPTDGSANVDDPNTPEWHAQRIIWRLAVVRDEIRLIEQGGAGASADRLADTALQLGCDIWTAMYKIGLEGNTALGAKVRGGGDKGTALEYGNEAERREQRATRIAAWEKARSRGLNKGDADRAAAKECGVGERTIREARKGLF